LIIILNGVPNAGKSTVASRLVEALPKGANLEVDWLKKMLSSHPDKDCLMVNIENAISVASNFVKEGFNIVISYPLQPQFYSRMLEGLSELETDIFIFTLCPPLEVALKKRGDRVLQEGLVERIHFLYKLVNMPHIGKFIDNSHQTPEETVNEILRAINMRDPESYREPYDREGLSP